MKTYKVTIKEISKSLVEVEANSHDEAITKVMKEYWKNPLDYVFETYDTYFEI